MNGVRNSVRPRCGADFRPYYVVQSDKLVSSHVGAAHCNYPISKIASVLCSVTTLPCTARQRTSCAARLMDVQVHGAMSLADLTPRPVTSCGTRRTRRQSNRSVVQQLVPVNPASHLETRKAEARLTRFTEDAVNAGAEHCAVQPPPQASLGWNRESG